MRKDYLKVSDHWKTLSDGDVCDVIYEQPWDNDKLSKPMELVWRENLTISATKMLPKNVTPMVSITTQLECKTELGNSGWWDAAKKAAWFSPIEKTYFRIK